MMMGQLSTLMPHLLLAPILLPMLTAALMLLLGERAIQTKRNIGSLSCLLSLLVAVFLVAWVRQGGHTPTVGVYLPGNWPVPFGVVLVADRLTAMMLLITAIVGFAAVLFARAGWDRAGVHFHPLFQLQLMGVNGAFLTGDLFNLFVFFEIMLTASYGLLLHGTGWPRVRASLPYITINLLASSMFLLGASMLFGVTGTLNLADMANKIRMVPVADHGLLHAGAALLLVAFLAKAAIWPLNFWLTPTYAAASPPVAALFTIMTKVGLYALLRIWTLLFSSNGLAAGYIDNSFFIWSGLLTMAWGSIGMLASQHLGRLAGFSVLVSSGTLLTAFGFGHAILTASALYYLIGSTLALCALFLVTDLVARSRQEEEKVPAFPLGGYQPFNFIMPEPAAAAANPETNLDEQERPLFGQPIPAALAALGMAFILCALMIAGLPPLSSFIGKITMMTALFNPWGINLDGGRIHPAAWVFLALTVLSGLFATIAYSRVGIRFFWAPRSRPAPYLKVIEFAPIALLLTLCVLLMAFAGAVLRYTERTAVALHAPQAYIHTVMGASVKPSPATTADDGVRVSSPKAQP